MGQSPGPHAASLAGEKRFVVGSLTHLLLLHRTTPMGLRPLSSTYCNTQSATSFTLDPRGSRSIFVPTMSTGFFETKSLTFLRKVPWRHKSTRKMHRERVRGCGEGRREVEVSNLSVRQLAKGDPSHLQVGQVHQVQHEAFPVSHGNKLPAELLRRHQVAARLVLVVHCQPRAHVLHPRHHFSVAQQVTPRTQNLSKLFMPSLRLVRFPFYEPRRLLRRALQRSAASVTLALELFWWWLLKH